MARYTVTGGAGFIGSHIVQALVERGDQVRILDDLSSGRRENLEEVGAADMGSGAQVEFLEGDIRDPDACARACAGVRGVFHQAAQVSVPRSVEDPGESYSINVMGTLNVLEGARRAGVHRVVAASSSAVYGDSEVLPKHEGMEPNPLSPYASGKLAGEHLLAVWNRLHGLQTVALRYFNIFGPRQVDDSPYTGVIAIFARGLLAGEDCTIHGDGGQTRDFTFVANAVAANLLAMDAPDRDGLLVCNVGTGERISINDLFGAMAEETGRPPEAEHAEGRAGDVRHSLASLERASAELGYAPSVPWRAGLAVTLEWYRGR